MIMAIHREQDRLLPLSLSLSKLQMFSCSDIPSFDSDFALLWVSQVHSKCFSLFFLDTIAFNFVYMESKDFYKIYCHL